MKGIISVRRSAIVALSALLLAYLPVAHAATLTITTPSTQTAVVGSAFSLQIVTSGGSGGNQFTVATGTLPTGLSLNINTGLISGSPTASISAAVTIRVTDNSAATATTSSFLINTGWMVSSIAGTAGVATESGIGGLATSASFDPHGISIHPDGTVYFTDATTSRINKIDSNGVLSTVFTASTTVTGIVVRENGDIFFNTYGGTNRIQKYTASTQTTAVWSSTDTSFNQARGAISDSTGIIYVADAGTHRIKKFALDGTMSVLGGNGSASSSGDDGLATSAAINYPGDVAIDSQGNLYLTELNSARIRKIATDGKIYKVLGDGTTLYSGDGGLATSARTAGVWGVAVDGADNLFFIEKGGTAVRRVDAQTGIVTRVAGTGSSGVNGSPVNGISSLATFSNLVMAIRFDRQGNLYIVDYSNKQIRKIAGIGTPFTTVAPTLTFASVSTVRKGLSTTLATTASTSGKVTFFANGKRIPGCIGKSATGAAPITINCSWKPSATGSVVVRAVLTPTSNPQNPVVTTLNVAVDRRSTKR
jgi:sugar lactone lactonase YvrE